MTVMNPLVQARIKNTFSYFTSACAGTGIGVYMMRNSARVMNMNPFLLFGGSIVSMIACMFTDYH